MPYKTTEIDGTIVMEIPGAGTISWQLPAGTAAVVEQLKEEEPEKYQKKMNWFQVMMGEYARHLMDDLQCAPTEHITNVGTQDLLIAIRKNKKMVEKMVSKWISLAVHNR